MLNRIGAHYYFNWSKVAKVINISERTLRDWRSEKYNMSYEALLRLQKLVNISIPKDKKVLPEHWSAKKFARKGALRRYQLYGDLGTPEGRRKGGINSQKLFRLNPEYARSLGIIMRKDIRKPRPSIELAEFIGIMLGDGGMTNYQINVTFNSQTCGAHGIFIRNLIKWLFRISALISKTASDNADRIVASGVNLVEFLIDKGLKIGNKVTNQVCIPKWIYSKREYKIACLRGLMDTDGSFYSYSHRVNGRIYKNYALDFTNRSGPLLQGVRSILENLGYTPTMARNKVVLNKRSDINNYAAMVGSSNPRTREKFLNCRYCDYGKDG